MNSYELSRRWFDWAFENPEKINPNHSAIYFFAIEHCNRLGWRDKFGFPTQMAMDAIGIKKHQTYIRYLNDLVDWGFIIMAQRSSNQYSANIISLINAMPKNGKALDKAIINHAAKQTESMGQSNSSIDKPLTINNKQINQEHFNSFWDLYGKKIEREKCEKKFKSLSETDIKKIFEALPSYLKSTPDLTYRKNPSTWLNNKCWNDEVSIKPKPIINMASPIL